MVTRDISRISQLLLHRDRLIVSLPDLCQFLVAAVTSGHMDLGSEDCTDSSPPVSENASPWVPEVAFSLMVVAGSIS